MVDRMTIEEIEQRIKEDESYEENTCNKCKRNVKKK